MNKQTKDKTNAPVDTVKLGRVLASIWQNDTESGPRYNVTFQRLYRSGTQWKYSDNFGRDDLLLLAKVADLAHSRIFELRTATEEDAA